MKVKQFTMSMPRPTKIESETRKIERFAQKNAVTFTRAMVRTAKTRGAMRRAFAAHTRLVLREWPHLSRLEAWSYSLQLLLRELEQQPLFVKNRWEAEFARKLNSYIHQNENKILPRKMMKKFQPRK